VSISCLDPNKAVPKSKGRWMKKRKEKGLLGKRSLTKTLLKEIKYQTKNKINRRRKEEVKEGKIE